MISKKMQHLLTSGQAFQALFEDGSRLANKFGKENIYDFSIGNPSTEPPNSVKEAIFNILNEEEPHKIHSYTNPAGILEVREKIALAINEEFNTDYDETNILMTCSAAGALNILFRSILDPQDEIIAFSPYFGEYEPFVESYDGKLVVVPTNPETFQPDSNALEGAINNRTKAVIINSPNNPTGVIYSDETLTKLTDVLKKKEKELGHPIYLIADEPYRRLAFDGVNVPFIPDFYPNTLVCYSFSKALSLPGERIGYLIVPTEVDGFHELTAALSTANRISIVNAPSLFQKVIPYCIHEKTDLSVYDKNRKYLYHMLTELGYECIYPQGAFYLFPKSPISDDKAFCKEAQKHRIVVAPGSAFGCPGHFRISYCVSFETIQQSYESFKSLAEQYRR